MSHQSNIRRMNPDQRGVRRQILAREAFPLDACLMYLLTNQFFIHTVY